MDRLSIIKIGGKVVETPESLTAFLLEFNKISGNKILVHGGGRSATNIAAKLGIETKMVEGRRITDEAMLDVVVMVYAGLVNKRIVAGLQALDCNAAGFSGADLDLIRAKKRPVQEIDYGFVGDIEEVNTKELRLLLNENIVPVIAPLTHNGQGLLLNTNADTIASALAVELSNVFNVNLIFCFEKKGVLSDPENEESIIFDLTYNSFLEYKQDGVVNAGMIPKLDNGFNAIKNGVKEVLITNAENIATGRGTRLFMGDRF